MIAVFAFTLMILAAAGCFVGANFCESGSPAQLSLVGLGSGLVGAVLPSIPNWLQSLTNKPRDSQAGHAHLHTMCSLGLVGLVALLALMFSLPTTSGCRNVKPDQYFDAVVDCAKVNPEHTAASAAVLTCVTGAIAGNAIACIAQLPTVAHWTIDEAACVIADIAQRENAKVGTAAGSVESLALRNEAVDWMSKRRVRIINSYAGEP